MFLSAFGPIARPCWCVVSRDALQIRALVRRNSIQQRVAQGHNGTDCGNFQGPLLPLPPVRCRRRHYQAPPHARPGCSPGTAAPAVATAHISCLCRDTATTALPPSRSTHFSEQSTGMRCPRARCTRLQRVCALIVTCVRAGVVASQARRPFHGSAHQRQQQGQGQASGSKPRVSSSGMCTMSHAPCSSRHLQHRVIATHSSSTRSHAPSGNTECG